MSCIDAYIALGGNLGDVQRAFDFALRRLSEGGTRVVGFSSLYRTKSAIIASQPDFLNAACHVQTTLAATDLLATLLLIEKEAGRTRLSPHAARTLDLDLLLYGDVQIATPDLQVPHPRLVERPFVLRPLVEIAPDVVIPPTDLTATKWLEKLFNPNFGIVEIIGGFSG
jgi:2-amino-4-hydroxy-6-hydroxymethyldihydropteridine diphosphokinase